MRILLAVGGGSLLLLLIFVWVMKTYYCRPSSLLDRDEPRLPKVEQASAVIELRVIEHSGESVRSISPELDPQDREELEKLQRSKTMGNL